MTDLVPVVVAIITAIVGPVIVVRVQRKTRADVEKVRALAAPLGNGYAQNTTSALARIEAEQQRQGEQLTETRTDIGGMRSEMRGLRRETSQLRDADRDLHQRINELHPQSPPAGEPGHSNPQRKESS